MSARADEWASWLTGPRGVQAALGTYQTELSIEAMAIARAAHLGPSFTVLEVGCGDGGVGLQALSMIGTSGHVVFTDIDLSVLRGCRRGVRSRDVCGRTSYVVTELPRLDGFAPATFDAVLSRSVLLHVRDLFGCFEAFRRVLRPAGRLAVVEPVAPPVEPAGRLWGLDVSGFESESSRMKAMLAEAMRRDGIRAGSNPPELVDAAHRAGFLRVKQEIRSSVVREVRLPAGGWDSFWNIPPYPGGPSPCDLANAVLRSAESDALALHLQGQFSAGLAEITRARVLMSAWGST